MKSDKKTYKKPSMERREKIAAIVAGSGSSGPVLVPLDLSD